jgi:hypothetical protein
MRTKLISKTDEYNYNLVNIYNFYKIVYCKSSVSVFEERLNFK